MNMEHSNRNLNKKSIIGPISKQCTESPKSVHLETCSPNDNLLEKLQELSLSLPFDLTKREILEVSPPLLSLNSVFPSKQSSNVEEPRTDASRVLQLRQDASNYLTTDLKKKRPAKGFQKVVTPGNSDYHLRHGTKSPPVQFFGCSPPEVPTHPVGQGTGICFHDDCSLHRHPFTEKVSEAPDRYSACMDRLKELGLLRRCKALEAKPVSEANLLLVHSKRYVADMKATQTMSTESLSELTRSFASEEDDVYFNNDTYNSARLAAGATLKAAMAVARGTVKNAAVIVRPPGHHAMQDRPNGYCIFNNVALAATHLVRNRLAKRVMILDWDVHHGNGTQSLCWDNPNILCISLHRYAPNLSFFPHIKESGLEYSGPDGSNINIPWETDRLTEADYLAAFHHVVLPAGMEFQPEVILVSAGYDSCLGDPKGQMLVHPVSYARFIRLLSSMARGKLCLVMEGGYNLPILAEAVALSVKALLGDPPALVPRLAKLHPSAESTIKRVLRWHSKFWKCFQGFKDLKLDGAADSPPIVPMATSGINLGDIGRMAVDALHVPHPLVPAHRVGVVYDARMLLHKHLSDNRYPENPQRLINILDRLKSTGLWKECYQIESRMATQTELRLCHHATYIDFLVKVHSLERSAIDDLEHETDSVYFHPDSFESASVAVGCTINAINGVLDGVCQSAMCIVRPPGHHAEDSRSCGFCLFNNVAIATRHARFNRGVARVAVIDWDVHHGNGIEKQFYDDPTVLYISIHRYAPGSFFPGTGAPDDVGAGPGTGCNVNIAWTRGGMADHDYLSAFTSLVLPLLSEFEPELTIVSAGFDASRGDPIGGCRVTPEGFQAMTSLLPHPSVLVLEGGYSPTAVPKCVAGCISALLGESAQYADYHHQSTSAWDSILETASRLKRYWRCLQLLPDPDPEGAPLLVPAP